LEELAQRRQLPRLRGRREAARRKAVEIGAQRVGGRGGEVAGNGFGGVVEVAAVAGQRILGGPALGAHHLQESVDAGGTVHCDCFGASFSGGMRTESSACFGLTNMTSANIVP